MGFFVRLVSLCALLFGSLAVVAPPAQAQTITFRIQSDVDEILRLEFSSATWENRFWPGSGKSWVLDDYEEHSYKLNCSKGEKICYGAWEPGGETRWGRGYRADRSCKTCCFTCNGGTTRLITLTY